MFALRSRLASAMFLALVAAPMPAVGDAAPAQDRTGRSPSLPAVLGGGSPSFSPAPADEVRLPRLLDLGAGKCIPCRQMKPILDDLAQNYATTFETIFIDVWENREEGRRYGIRMIPTQIFFDAAGKELFRHEGFIAKKDILAKWREFGVDAEAAAVTAAPEPAATPQG